MTDDQIAYAFYYIGIYGLDRPASFWNIVLPLVKKQLATLDRQCPEALSNFIQSAGYMQLQDNEFWETVEKKLVDERLYRYLRLDQVCNTVEALGRVGRGSDELIELLEKDIIKHRRALDEQMIDTARRGFAELNKGSAVLFEVLEDPSRGVPQIEGS